MARLKKNWRTIEPLQKEDFIAYFEFCLSEGDPDSIISAIGDMARAHGMSQVAKTSGLSEEYLCQILSDEGNPKFSTIARVIKALGMTLYAAGRSGRCPIHLRKLPAIAARSASSAHVRCCHNGSKSTTRSTSQDGSACCHSNWPNAICKSANRLIRCTRGRLWMRHWRCLNNS